MKRLFLLICTLLLTLSVAACGGDNSGGGLRGQTGRKKTLTYLVSAESTAYKNILNDDVLKIIEMNFSFFILIPPSLNYSII